MRAASCGSRLGAVRVKLGRPDISAYVARFAVPRASETSPLTVTFLGVTTLLVDAGRSAIMTDGFFSRPGLLATGVGRIAPKAGRIERCLAKAGVSRLEAMLPVHSHDDHALDSAAVAERTGATLVGGRSMANIGRGHGLPDEQIVVATPAKSILLGAYTMTLIVFNEPPRPNRPDQHPNRPPTSHRSSPSSPQRGSARIPATDYHEQSVDTEIVPGTNLVMRSPNVRSVGAWQR
jgi:hypothetical protein